MTAIDYEERLSEYDTEMYYCEFCGQLFATNDVFHAHRQASDIDRAKAIISAKGYQGKTEVQPGERVGEVVVGSEPCDGSLMDDTVLRDMRDALDSRISRGDER